MTNLSAVPVEGARFSAIPHRRRTGTFPVRAIAVVPLSTNRATNARRRRYSNNRTGFSPPAVAPTPLADGISAVMRVPWPAGCRPDRRPAPRRGPAAGMPCPALVRAADAVVGDVDPQDRLAAAATLAEVAARTWRRWRAPRTPRSTRSPPPPRQPPVRHGAHRRRHGGALGQGRDRRTEAASVRIAGWMPRASSRSSRERSLSSAAASVGGDRLRIRVGSAAAARAAAGEGQRRRAAAARRRAGRAPGAAARNRRPRRSAPATAGPRLPPPAGREVADDRRDLVRPARRDPGLEVTGPRRPGQREVVGLQLTGLECASAVAARAASPAARTSVRGSDGRLALALAVAGLLLRSGRLDVSTVARRSGTRGPGCVDECPLSPLALPEEPDEEGDGDRGRREVPGAIRTRPRSSGRSAIRRTMLMIRLAMNTIPAMSTGAARADRAGR